MLKKSQIVIYLQIYKYIFYNDTFISGKHFKTTYLYWKYNKISIINKWKFDNYYLDIKYHKNYISSNTHKN